MSRIVDWAEDLHRLEVAGVQEILDACAGTKADEETTKRTWSMLKASG